jgi:Raf kinase inhibitor-like YbhB/YbcL family protein
MGFEGFDKMKNTKMLQNFYCFIILFIFLYSCQNNNKSSTSGSKQMDITSSAFNEGAMIPGKYTCDGIDISPPLKWSDEPGGTKTFAVICDDPDAPMGTWVHWVLFNLPADIHELSEDIPPTEILQNRARQGKNDFGKIGYGGPCPPGGAHRYYFKVYALSEELNIESGITKSALLKAMEGKILAEGQLMGRYGR